MNKKLYPYIKDGISIDGDEIKGYSVFTISTQRFYIKSLDELTPNRFKLAIKNLDKREKYTEEMLKEAFPDNLYFDFEGYIKLQENEKLQ